MQMIAVATTLAVAGAGSVTYAQQQSGTPTTTVESEAAPEPVPAQEPGGRGFVDKAKNWAEDVQIVERLSGDVDGWYPRLGGMTRGSGFAIGPGYRLHLFDNRIFADVGAGISTKGYKSAEANVRWWQGWGERIELWSDYRYEDFPQEDFFGVGMDSMESARTSYDFDSVDVSVRGLVKPAEWLRGGVRLGYMSPDIGTGTDKKYPSTELLFADAVAPGLLDQPDFMHTTFFTEVDTLDAAGHPRKGGFYRASLGFWDDRTLEQFDHKRFDALAIHYVPLDTARNHVISGRIGTSYVNNETGERVPFYFLAYVGGRDTVRSFREFRFKDENAVWVGAEYNYRPWKWVSLATFIDAGEVTPNWNDIDFQGMNTGYGFGVRVHNRRQTFARLDFGTGGGEGWQMFIKLGPSF
jgi:outer membrane protein assembly factor BamA